MYEQPYNPYRNNVAIIKDYFKTPIVLALAIMNIVSIILAVVSSLVSMDTVKEVSAQISAYFDANVLALNSGSGTEFLGQISESLHQSAQYSGVFSVFGSISAFGILTAVALFMIYFKCRSDKPDDAPSAGVTLLYVVTVITLVFSILATLALIAGAVLMFFLYVEFQRRPDLAFSLKIASHSFRIDETVILALAIAFTFFAIIGSAVMLFFIINRTRYIGSVRKSMNSVELTRKGAKAYGVFCIISAVFTAMSLISSIPALFSAQAVSIPELNFSLTITSKVPFIFSVFTTSLSLAMLILQAKLALGYAKYIDNKKYGYGEPAAPVPYAPAGVGVGSHAQPTPYSYLAQPKTEDPGVKDDSFVNPYLEQEESPSAEPTCPACGAKVDGKAPFCGQCGTKL